MDLNLFSFLNENKYRDEGISAIQIADSTGAEKDLIGTLSTRQMVLVDQANLIQSG
jgi:hypothetical protein